MTQPLIGRIYDIQGFSVQDGPGIRTTVFLKGCPLRCPWCHSPESQAFYPQLSWVSMRCVGTEKCQNRCIGACPLKAIAPAETRLDSQTREPLRMIHVDRTLCDNCGECVKVCHPHALFLCGQDYTVEEIVKKVLADRSFFEQSGGGATISGGEALCQPAFTLELMKRLKGAGIHTALDTTGFVPWSAVEAILSYTDLFLYDIKHMDSKKHEDIVGVPNEQILDNARKIAAAGGKFQIRIPVIPLFNDDEENIQRTAKFCCGLGEAVTLVQLLPYHNLGVAKYQRISDEKVMEATPPSDKKMQRLKAIMEGYGLPVTIH